MARDRDGEPLMSLKETSQRGWCITETVMMSTQYQKIRNKNPLNRVSSGGLTFMETTLRFINTSQSGALGQREGHEGAGLH